MTSYEVTREITAPASDVWAVLTDAKQLAAPAFGIIDIVGDIRLGERLKLTSEIDPKRAFSLKVTTLEKEKKMVWTGGMPLGLFKGIRTFSLTPTDAGTRFEMDEVFSGPLAGMMAKVMPDLQPSFEKFADALKLEVER